MSREHVTHSDILRFAEARVNLKRDDAKKFREQAKNLKEKLEAHIKQHPDFVLKKLILSGSLAKGTSLKSTSDIDMALYVDASDAPGVEDVASWLADKLREAYPQMKPDQIKPQRYSVCISYSGTGLDIDIVPILYDGDPDWKGNLVSQVDGTLLMTSIPMHLEFIRKRKNSNDRHYAQVIRLLKYWVKQQKAKNPDFKCKSFLTELIVAHLYDNGKLTIKDYPTALQECFSAIAAGLLNDPIIFSDYYSTDSVPDSYDPVQVIDPVNEKNNVAMDYTNTKLHCLEEAALEAGDAIEAAEYAPTKQETVGYWREVFGSSFSV